MTLPPLSAIGTAHVSLFGPAALGYPRWGVATWGGSVWTDHEWRDVTPQSMHVVSGWGADSAVGVLSVPVAGTWSVITYDPERLLDPSNPDSEFAPVLHPGTLIRFSYDGAVQRGIRTGAIESITYSIDDAVGTIRATDGIADMVRVKVPAGTPGAPDTLRARARWLVQAFGLSNVGVEADAGYLWGIALWGSAIWTDGDPFVGAALTDVASVWDWMMTSAMDCLYAVWLDGDNVLRFRSYGGPRDLGLVLGDGGISMEDLQLEASSNGVYSKVIGYDDGAPAVPIAVSSEVAVAKWGVDAVYERTRPVPEGLAWVGAVLTDRADAGLQYAPQELRPTTEAELVALIDAGMVDIAHIAVSTRRDGTEDVVPPIAVDGRIVGGVV